MKVALCIAIALAGFLAAPTGVQAAGVSCQQADVTDDGRVTLGDLSELAGWFLRANPPKGYDLDGDGRVTVLDLAAVAGRFGERCSVAVESVLVVASADDGFWLNAAGVPTAIDITSNTISAGFDSSLSFTGHAWLRFITTIPEGAPIVSATITLKGVTVSGTPLLKVHVEDAANPAAPTTAANADGRSLAATAVDWDGIGAGTQTSPDLAAVIQQAVNRVGFSGTLQIFVKDDGSGTGADNLINATSYNGSAANAPTLDVTYGTAASSVAPSSVEPKRFPDFRTFPTGGRRFPEPTQPQVGTAYKRFPDFRRF